MGDALGLWDGKPIKLDCDDHCTTVNVINSLSNLKKTIKNELMCRIETDSPHIFGVPVVAQWVTNPTSIHKDKSSIPGLTQWG